MLTLPYNFLSCARNQQTISRILNLYKTDIYFDKVEFRISTTLWSVTMEYVHWRTFGTNL